MIRAQPGSHVLRVNDLRSRRKPDEVTEQHRHDLALLSRRPRRRNRQGGGAIRAKREVARNLLVATGTGRHRTSLRPPRCQSDNSPNPCVVRVRHSTSHHVESPEGREAGSIDGSIQSVGLRPRHRVLTAASLTRDSAWWDLCLVARRGPRQAADGNRLTRLLPTRRPRSHSYFGTHDARRKGRAAARESVLYSSSATDQLCSPLSSAGGTSLLAISSRRTFRDGLRIARKRAVRQSTPYASPISLNSLARWARR